MIRGQPNASQSAAYIYFDFFGEKNDVIEPLVAAGGLAFTFLLPLLGLDFTVDTGRLDPANGEDAVALLLMTCGFFDGVASFWTVPATLDLLSFWFCSPTGAKKDLTLLGFGMGFIESELRNLVEFI